MAQDRNVWAVLFRVLPVEPDPDLSPDKQLIGKVGNRIKKHEVGISQGKLLNRPIQRLAHFFIRFKIRACFFAPSLVFYNITL